MASTIEKMIEICNELLAALKLKRKKQFSEWLAELEDFINDELELAGEFGGDTMTPVFTQVKAQITQIKRNKANSAKCTEIIIAILQTLKGIKDQRKARDEIIKSTIQPAMKSWGYKKKARAFSKKEGNLEKKVNIYTSRTSLYYELSFTFEVSIKGPGINVNMERPEEKWFKLDQYTDINSLKAEIQAFLLEKVKPFLDSYK